ncbi:MAG: methyltransferase domain-containing protein [Bryobacterales bacterium]|nr:methyltransferase domain-containing protein [Bryobacterales bacterium]
MPLKELATTGSVSAESGVATALSPAATELANVAGFSSPCPACGSPAYGSVLSADTCEGSRSLVSCSRCGLLRFLGESTRSGNSRFSDFVQRKSNARNLAETLLGAVRRVAMRGPLQFVLSLKRARKTPDLLLHVDATDGWLGRELEQRYVDCVVVTPSHRDAARAFHREGVFAVVAESEALPLRLGSVDTVLRLRGFSTEADPAGWITHLVRRLRPGGRVVLQVFDCSSWGFLLCGSRWVGLEPDSARYAYRAEDLEVLLELCGMRVARRSHFFPMLNAMAWASSLFPSLDANVALAGAAEQRTFRSVVLYVLALLALLPLALVESVCHTGSVLLLEAERKV